MSTHPSWCALEACTADTGFGAQHRGAPVTFTTPAVTVELTLHQPTPGLPTDVFVTAVVTADGAGHAGVTASVADAWGFVDVVTELLERVR